MSNLGICEALGHTIWSQPYDHKVLQHPRKDTWCACLESHSTRVSAYCLEAVQFTWRQRLYLRMPLSFCRGGGSCMWWQRSTLSTSPAHLPYKYLHISQAKGLIFAVISRIERPWKSTLCSHIFTLLAPHSCKSWTHIGVDLFFALSDRGFRSKQQQLGSHWQGDLFGLYTNKVSTKYSMW